MASTRSKLDEIVAAFATLEDPRSEVNRRHPLPSVLVIAVLAVLAGAALIFVSILLTPLSARVGAPLLLIFLLIGMIVGEDGPGGVAVPSFVAR